MSDRIDHRVAAERILGDAALWAAQAEEPMPEAGELSCLAYAAVHALLAIHDTLTDRPDTEWNFNEVRWRREVMPWEGALTAEPCDCARHDAYAAREAEQRETAITHRTECVTCGWASDDRPDARQATVDAIQHAEGEHGGAWRGRIVSTATPTQPEQREAVEPDPLDESDHRVRVDRHGNTWQRVHEGCWMEPGFPPLSHGPAQCLPLRVLPFPLTFAPDADGAPSVTASADDDPVDDAVDGKEGERRYLNAQDAEFSRLLAVSTDPTAALRRAAMMEAVGVTDDQAKLFAQVLAKGRLLPSDLQRLKAAVERAGDGRG